MRKNAFLWFRISWKVIFKYIIYTFYYRMHLYQNFKCPLLAFCERLTSKQYKLVHLDVPLDIRIKIFWLKLPKVSKKIDTNKRHNLLKQVSIRPSLNKTEIHLHLHFPSSVSLPSRKRTSHITCIFCGILGHEESKCWNKLEALNEGMQKN